MPGFNPASIGAPSPVGRGGGGAIEIGAVVWRASNPDPLKYILCSGTYLSGQFQASWPFKLVASAVQVSTAATTIPGNGALRNVIYSQGLFVALTTAGIFTSSDAATWTQRSANGNMLAVTFAAGLFVAVGQSGTILTSPDAVTWTQRTSPASTSIDQIAYGNGKFAASVGGNPGFFVFSTDGINWTQANVLSGIQVTCLAYSPDLNLFAAGGYTSGGSTGYIYTSPDAVTWTQRVQGPSGGYPNSIAWGNGLFVSGQRGGYMQTSANGISWASNYTIPVGGESISVLFAAGFWFVLCQEYSCWTSDLQNWSYRQTDPNTPNAYYKAVYALGGFYTFLSSNGSVRVAAAPEDSVFIPKVPQKTGTGGKIFDPFMRIAA